MKISENIEAIVLDPNLTSQDKIEQLGNYSDDELKTIKFDAWNLNIVEYACRHGDIATIQYLIDRFPHLLDPSQSEYGGSVLHQAAGGNSYEVFKYLWENFPQFRETKDYRGYTLAHYAYGNEDIAIIEFLQQEEPKTFSLFSIFNQLPLHTAAQYGNPKTIRALTKLYKSAEDLDTLFGNENNPLHYAIMLNRVDNVKCLHELGMSLERPNNHGLLPVHLAAKYGSLDVLKYLKQKGQIDLTSVCNAKNKAQPIHFAVIYNHLPVLEWLYEQGIDITTSLLAGDHLIHLAAHTKNLEIIKWLIQKGVPHDLPNLQQKNILQILASVTRVALQQLAEEYSFNFLAYDGEGYTPLHNACRQLRAYKTYLALSDLIKLLTSSLPFDSSLLRRDWEIEETIRYQVFFWERDEYEEKLNELMNDQRFEINAGKKVSKAAKTNEQLPDDMELLQFFISKGSLLEQVTNDDEGNSVVHIAAQFNNCSMLTALAKANLSLHRPNAKNRYPIELAVNNGSLKTIEFLLEHVSHLLQPHDWHRLLCDAISKLKFRTLNLLLKENTTYYAASSAQLHQMNEQRFYPQHALAKHNQIIDRENSKIIIKILELLINVHEIDVNYQDSQGNTLLNLYCSLSFIEFEVIQPILKCLLDNGSYPYFRSSIDNKMPFDVLITRTSYYLKAKDFKQIYNLMQEYGIRTQTLPMFFGEIRAEQTILSKCIKYYPKIYLAELIYVEAKLNLLREALTKTTSISLNYC